MSFGIFGTVVSVWDSLISPIFAAHSHTIILNAFFAMRDHSESIYQQIVKNEPGPYALTDADKNMAQSTWDSILDGDSFSEISNFNTKTLSISQCGDSFQQILKSIRDDLSPLLKPHMHNNAASTYASGLSGPMSSR